MKGKKITEFINIENNKIIFIIILIGVSFMLFGGMGNTKKEKKDTPITVSEEERLCDILSQIKGVGRVSVMITYYSTDELDIAYETNKTSTQREEENSQNIQSNIDSQAVMSSGEPFVTRSIYPDVKGVVVAAEGAGDIEVREKIIKAVTTSLGVGSHRVCVAEKEK
ncbi:MAG: hypothetical protein IJD30_01875 [Clostridia bacterium]|nr:hypothetical protein [Clostridia bacterium]